MVCEPINFGRFKMLLSSYTRTLEEAMVHGSAQEDCLKWAFGDNYKEIDGANAPNIWNTRHGDLFKIKQEDNILETVYKIGKEFKLLGVENE